jgi:hypothetical protein
MISMNGTMKRRRKKHDGGEGGKKEDWYNERRINIIQIYRIWGYHSWDTAQCRPSQLLHSGFCSADFRPWRWRRYVPPKRRCISEDGNIHEVKLSLWLNSQALRQEDLRRSGVIAPPITELDTIRRWMLSLKPMPLYPSAVPIEKEDGWLQSRFAPLHWWKTNPGFLARSPSLHQLSYQNSRGGWRQWQKFWIIIRRRNKNTQSRTRKLSKMTMRTKKR